MSVEVGIDVTPVLNKIPRGIGSYIFELTTHMVDIDYKFLFKISRLKYPSRLARLWYRGWPFFEISGVPFFFTKFQLFHGTDAYIPESNKFRKVLTIHDVYPIIDSPHGRAANKIRQAVMRQPDALILISEFAKKEFLKFFPDFKEKVFVVYHGVSDFWKILNPEECSYVFRKFNIKSPFYLYVGDSDRRKNLDNLFVAFSHLKERVQLVIAGGFLKGNQRELIKRLGIKERVKEVGYVSREDLRCLYNRAIAFVFVSLYEGFGLPLLEAMKCGTPVVASNIEVFREIAGGAYIEVEPLSPLSIAEGLRTVLDSQERSKFVESGLQVSSQFTWVKTAEETRKVYNLVLNHGKA